MNSYSIIWQSVLAHIKDTLPEAAYKLWFPETELFLLDDKRAVIKIPSDLKKNILTTKFGDTIKDALATVIGFNLPIIIVSSEEKEPDPADFDDQIENNFSKGEIIDELEREANSPSHEEYERKHPSTLYSDMKNPEYQFDNFIVGNSNKMAYAASLAVANNPSLFEQSNKENYNPLFIFGNSGLGKTHLLYAIMNRISERFPELVIIYVKGEEFTTELINCISQKTTSQFKNKYRKADVLLIDDIQFIAGKDSIQEEFFHTFNALYEAKKQIILAADRPPRDMNRLEDRLKSRFEWGLMADIQVPDYELRTAIIKDKAKKMGVNIPADCLVLIAEKLKSNIRQLEGVVRKIAAQNFLTGTPITKEVVLNCIHDIYENPAITEITTDKIIKVVSKKYGILDEDIKGRKRQNEIANARHIAIYLMSQIKGMTSTQIGKFFDRNHTTVLASIKIVEERMKDNPLFKIEIDDIIKDIKDV